MSIIIFWDHRVGFPNVVLKIYIYHINRWRRVKELKVSAIKARFGVGRMLLNEVGPYYSG